jgi:hypothetical protein
VQGVGRPGQPQVHSFVVGSTAGDGVRSGADCDGVNGTPLTDCRALMMKKYFGIMGFDGLF